MRTIKTLAFFKDDILVFTGNSYWEPVSGPVCVISLLQISSKRREEFKTKVQELFKEYSKNPGLIPVNGTNYWTLNHPNFTNINGNTTES